MIAGMSSCTSTASTIPAAPVDAAGDWVSITEAVGRLGLSERTIRRQLADGRLRSRLTADRREILVPPDTGTRLSPPDTGTGSTGGHPPVIVRQGGIEAEAVAELAQRVAGLIERQTVELRAELSSTRRAARWGWSVAAGVAVLGSAGAVWGVRAVEGQRGRADAADAARAVYVELVELERVKADRLAATVGELTDAIVRQGQAVTTADTETGADRWHPPLVP